jgi:hypothetical protein
MLESLLPFFLGLCLLCVPIAVVFALLFFAKAVGSLAADRLEAQYWREKWHYAPGNDPETLLRGAAAPRALKETLLRPVETDVKTDSRQLLRAEKTEAGTEPGETQA